MASKKATASGIQRREDLFTRVEAAQYLGLSVGWLAAHIEDGPKITRLNGRRAYYLKTDLDAYVEERRKLGSKLPSLSAPTAAGEKKKPGRKPKAASKQAAAVDDLQAQLAALQKQIAELQRD